MHYAQFTTDKNITMQPNRTADCEQQSSFAFMTLAFPFVKTELKTIIRILNTNLNECLHAEECYGKNNWNSVSRDVNCSILFTMCMCIESFCNREFKISQFIEMGTSARVFFSVYFQSFLMQLGLWMRMEWRWKMVQNWKRWMREQQLHWDVKHMVADQFLLLLGRKMEKFWKVSIVIIYYIFTIYACMINH